LRRNPGPEGGDSQVVQVLVPDRARHRVPVGSRSLYQLERGRLEAADPEVPGVRCLCPSAREPLRRGTIARCLRWIFVLLCCSCELLYFSVIALHN
jgi:hypothetical protein